MVQWVEKIAFLLLAIYNGIWEELQATGYLQVDETPVKVLDPEVKGKAATGYLWFYSHPKGDVFLEFCEGRGRDQARRNAWLIFRAPSKPMPMPFTIRCGGNDPPCSGAWVVWRTFAGGGIKRRKSRLPKPSGLSGRSGNSTALRMRRGT